MKGIHFSILIRKDVASFFRDRRMVLISLITPILLASFFGILFRDIGKPRAFAPIVLYWIDEDRSPISQAIAEGWKGEKRIELRRAVLPAAVAAVRQGQASAAIHIPREFGRMAIRALFAPSEKPHLRFYFDPSRTMESAMIQGLLAQQIMQSVGREAFQGSLGRDDLKEYRASLEQGGGPAGEEGRLLRSMLQQIDAWQEMHAGDTLEKKTSEGFSSGLSIPYTVQEEEVTAGTGIRYNAFAQAFAGMGVQFILFASINEGVAILEERRKGIWKRLRCAPVSRITLLLSRIASSALIAWINLTLCFLFGILVWGIRIHGSLLGFFGLCLGCALVTSACGLFLAAIGGNPLTTRVVAIAALLFLLMLGGAWIPSFLFPAWLQQISLWNPIYWAMQGFSGVTWRGQDLQAVLPAMAVVFGFAIFFAALALWRFRWEE